MSELKALFFVSVLGAIGLAGIAVVARVDRERIARESPGSITAAAMADGVVVVRYDLNLSDDSLSALFGGTLPRRIPEGRSALLVGHCQDQPEAVCFGQIPQTR